MKYLIDTHTLIWIAENSPKLSLNAKKVFLNQANPIYVSVISFWEIALKLNKGILTIDGGLPKIEGLVDEKDIATLPVKREYIRLLSNMPFHHKDPFDRLLISSAMYEDMTIITTDEHIPKYDVKVLW